MSDQLENALDSVKHANSASIAGALRDAITELRSTVEQLKDTISDHESTIVSQQEELWRLRDIVGGRW